MYFAIEVECRAGKASFHVSSVFLGRSLQANELALVCSLIGVFTNVEIWFDPSQAIHPDQRRAASSAINGARSFLSPYVLHYCSQSRMCLAERLLLAQLSPVAACQVHNWTTRDGKWTLTNDSLCGMAAFGPWKFYLVISLLNSTAF